MFWREIKEILISMLGLAECFHKAIDTNCSNTVSTEIVNGVIGQKTGSE